MNSIWSMSPHRRLPRFGEGLSSPVVSSPKSFRPPELRFRLWAGALITLVGWILAVSVPLLINPLFFVFGGYLSLRAAIDAARSEPIPWLGLTIGSLMTVATLVALAAYLAGALKLA